MKVTVKILNAEKEYLSKELPEGTYVLGRGTSCDIQLEDQAISRKHVEIRISDSTVYVNNLSTTARVFCNGKAVETAELSNGDEFTVGPYRILIFMGTQPQASVNPMDEAPVEAEGADPAVAPSDAPAEAEAPGFAEVPGFQPLEDPFAGFGEQQTPSDITPASGNIPEAAPRDTSAAEEAVSMGGETQVFNKPLAAKLIFETGPKTGEEILIETYEVTFGRSKKADVFIDDEKLSRVHAKITRMGIGYRLVDLNSRNGTYVNGMRVLEHPLNSFDIVTLGNTKFKFLIHDMTLHEGTHGYGGVGTDQTRSVQLTPSRKVELVELQKAHAGIPPIGTDSNSLADRWKRAPKRTKVLSVSVGVLALLFFLIPSGEKAPAPNTTAAPQVAQQENSLPPSREVTDPGVEKKVALPPSLPQEYYELSPSNQRSLEGHYQSALRAASQESYEEARFHMQKVHELVSYYKNSRDLATVYSNKLKAKQIAQAEAKARRDEKNDVNIYLEEGLAFLKRGKFDRASEAFTSAIALDPKSVVAQKGMRAAEEKVRNINDLKPKKDPNVERVIKLFQKAVAAFANKSYSEAIETAEEIRTIKLEDTKYLSEAKQIIDRARILQKEEFEPFLIQAKEKYAEADYNASRDLCEEMSKRDPAYEDAKECLIKAKRQLNRLAKEAYVHGYILESMNKIEEAKQYWLRAKSYVRKGDKYYDKVLKKLEFYQ